MPSAASSRASPSWPSSSARSSSVREVRSPSASARTATTQRASGPVMLRTTQRVSTAAASSATSRAASVVRRALRGVGQRGRHAGVAAGADGVDELLRAVAQGEVHLVRRPDDERVRLDDRLRRARAEHRHDLVVLVEEVVDQALQPGELLPLGGRQVAHVDGGDGGAQGGGLVQVALAVGRRGVDRLLRAELVGVPRVRDLPAAHVGVEELQLADLAGQPQQGARALGGPLLRGHALQPGQRAAGHERAGQADGGRAAHAHAPVGGAAAGGGRAGRGGAGSHGESVPGSSRSSALPLSDQRRPVRSTRSGYAPVPSPWYAGHATGSAPPICRTNSVRYQCR